MNGRCGRSESKSKTEDHFKMADDAKMDGVIHSNRAQNGNLLWLIGVPSRGTKKLGILQETGEGRGGLKLALSY